MPADAADPAKPTGEAVSLTQQVPIDITGAPASAVTPGSSPEVPSRYGVLERLAQGGMGIIYRAWDGRLRRELAMKLIRDRRSGSSHQPASSVSPETLARFVREAEITARLDHPGIVPIHDMDTDEQGRVFFTMRLVQGQRLDEVFALARLHDKHWSKTRVLDVIVKICETVAYAHSRGVIHRDLKPSNIMTGQFGETYVMDWGLAKNLRDARDALEADDNCDVETVIYQGGVSAKPLDSSDLLERPDSDLQTQPGAVLGTAAYMPPEQACGRIDELDERSDIYSVGAILYELLAGRRPYAVEGQPVVRSQKVIAEVIAGPPAPILSADSRVPAELVAICEKAMQRRKQDRYQTMTEMAEDLRAYLENRVVRAHQTGAAAELKKWVARNRRTAIAIGAGASIALALLLAVVGVQSAANKNLSAKNVEIVNANRQISQETVLKERALDEETRARKRADSELARAEGLILARASADVVATNPGQALLVALEAARRQPGDAANTALLAALPVHHEIRVLTGHRAPIRTAAFSQVSSRLVTITAGSDHTAIIWDVTTGEPLTWLLGHTNLLTSVRFSADGLRVATGSVDRSVRIWDARSGELLAILKGHEGPVWHIAFHPRGNRLVTCSRATARLWNLETGKQQGELSAQSVDSASLQPILTAEYSPDGSQIVTGGADQTARLWDATTGTPQFVLSGHEGSVGLVRFSLDGKAVLTSVTQNAGILNPGGVNLAPQRDAAVRVWDTTTGQLRATLPHATAIEAAVFGHDGRRVVTGSADGILRVWDAATGDVLHKLEVRRGAIHAVAWSPDDQLIAAGTNQGPVWLWDVAAGSQSALLGHTADVRTVDFISSGRVVTTSVDKTVRTWNVRSAGVVKPVKSGEDFYTPVEISADESRLLMRPVPSSKVVLASFPDGQQLAVLEHASTVRTARFSPQGSLLATVPETGGVHVYSAIDGQLRKMLDGPGQALQIVFSSERRLIVTSIADGLVTAWNLDDWSIERQQALGTLKGLVVSPDGRHFVTWSDSKPELTLWSTQSDVPVAAIPLIVDPAREIPLAAFSNDGRILATWSVPQSTLRLWHPATGAPIATIDVSGSRISQPLFGAATNRIATFSARSAEIWDASTGRLVTHLAGLDSSIEGVIISPDGLRVVTRSAEMSSRLWNGQTGESLGLLADRDNAIQSAHFSRNGQFLLTISGQGEKASFWRSADKERLAQISGGRTLLSSSAFSADGRWIVTGYRDGSAWIWPADPVEFVKTHIQRDLTADERDYFQIGTPEARLATHRAENLRSLITFLRLASRLPLNLDQAQVVQSASERLLHDSLQLQQASASSSRGSMLAQLERAVREEVDLTAPVAAAFAKLAAEFDKATPAK